MSHKVAANTSISSYYDFLFIELADPRTNDWFLVKHPQYIFSIIACYLYFVLHAGPKWMQNRKPFQFVNILAVYNIFQVALSSFLVYESLRGPFRKYSLVCEPVDYSGSEDSIRMAYGYYIYFLAKISELLDTIFFVLRKKERQITYLHVYHHSIMLFTSWMGVKYYPGGNGAFIGVINSYVHMIMYTYYFLSGLGPKYQKYLWWKRYITRLQMFQFCLIFIQQSLIIFRDCGYPKWPTLLMLPNVMYIYILFNDFYTAAYRKRSPTKDSKEICNKNIQEQQEKNEPISDTKMKIQ